MKNKGFTLIEMLVTVLIFSIVIGAIMGVFVSAIKLQRYNLTHQQLLSQVSYAMEYMDRAIRMTIRDDGSCGFAGKNYRISNGNTKIEFQNYEGDCQEFYLNTSVNPYQLAASKGTNFSDVFLTSNDFNLSSLQFNVSGDITGDFEQPKVTIFIEIEGSGSGHQPRIKIQTTVSQRNLDL